MEQDTFFIPWLLVCEEWWLCILCSIILHCPTAVISVVHLPTAATFAARIISALSCALQALGVPPVVRSSWFGPKVDAVEYYGTRLAKLNQKLRPKQEQKLEAAKVRRV